MFRVTYNGDGVASNKLGAFQNGTTAYTADEAVAREIATDGAWTVTAPDGSPVVASMTERREDPVHVGTDQEQFGKRHEKHKKQKNEDAKPQD